MRWGAEGRWGDAARSVKTSEVCGGPGLVGRVVPCGVGSGVEVVRGEWVSGVAIACLVLGMERGGVGEAEGGQF